VFVMYGLLGLIVLIGMMTRSDRVPSPSDRQILETVAIAETTSTAATSPAQSPPPGP